MGSWIWIAALMLIGLIGQPAWGGWLILGVAMLLLFPPLWRRLSLDGWETRERSRMVGASVITVLTAVLTWHGLGAGQRHAEIDKLLADSASTIEAANAAYPTEKHDFRWQYATTVDPMTDKAVKTACIISSNAVQLQPPYEATRAKLCLRDHPKYGKDAYVVLEKDGQTMCRSYENCAVHVRFDKKANELFPGIGPSDGSTNFIFIKKRAKLEDGIKSAGVTAVQAEFFQAGDQVMLFDTKGFSWK